MLIAGLDVHYVVGSQKFALAEGGPDIASTELVKAFGFFFAGWLCSAASPYSLGNCCHLHVQQILRRKCVKPRVLCRGWKWRQATPMKNDGSFKRQLSYFKQATLTTMCCLTLPFPPSVFFCSSFFFPQSPSLAWWGRTFEIGVNKSHRMWAEPQSLWEDYV